MSLFPDPMLVTFVRRRLCVDCNGSGNGVCSPCGRCNGEGAETVDNLVPDASSYHTATAIDRLWEMHQRARK